MLARGYFLVRRRLLLGTLPVTMAAQSGAQGGIAAADNTHEHLSQLESLHRNADRLLGAVHPQSLSIQCPNQHGVMWDLSIDASPAWLTTIKEMLDNCMDQARVDRALTYIAVAVRGGEIIVENDGSGMSTQRVHKPGSPAHGLPVAVACAGVFDFTSKSSTASFGVHSGGGGGAASGAGADPSAPTQGLAGKNGVGMKGVNGTADVFTLETQDPARRESLKATWRDCMRDGPKYKVTPWRGTKARKIVTRFTWTPNWDFFGMGAEAQAAAVHVIRRMAWCRAAILASAQTVPGNPLEGRGITFKWGECSDPSSPLRLKAVPWKGLRDIMLATTTSAPTEEAAAVAPSKSSKKADVLAATAEDGSCVYLVPGAGASMGVVNGMPCSRGTHMDEAWKLVRKAVEQAWKRCAKRHPDGPALAAKYTKPSLLQKHFSIAVMVTVPRASYSSQDKNELCTTKAQFWPHDLTLPHDTAAAKRVLDDAVGELVQLAAKHAETAAVKAGKDAGAAAKHKVVGGSGSRRRVMVDNYTPAIRADTRGYPCMLFLAEGESAKNYVMTLRSAVPDGTQRMGVYALKGKPISARKCKRTKVMANKEMSALASILGLPLFGTAVHPARLRYQNVVVAADMDTDGNHICGLIYSNLDAIWPELFVHDPNFVQRYATPLLRSTPSSSRPDLVFYSVEQMRRYVMQLSPRDRARVSLDHVKGLGQWPREVIMKQHAPNMDAGLVALTHTGQPTRDYLESAFGKDTDARKLLMDTYLQAQAVDYTQDAVPFPEWARIELLEHMWEHVSRNIPALEDGLCPAERKALWCISQSRTDATKKTAVVASDVTNRTKYAHGEASLQGVVSRLASSAVGRNNFNVLKSAGQFGSRNDPRSAQPRYTQTGPTPLTKALFPAQFLRVVPRVLQEREVVETKVLLSPIPVIFLNGRIGSIGTGYRSVVLPLHWDCILQAADAIARHTPIETWGPRVDEALPYWDGVVSNIVSRDGTVVIRGRVRVEDASHVSILDLPPGMWTEAYVEGLKALAASGTPTKKGGLRLRCVEDASTDSTVHIMVEVDPSTLAPLLETCHAAAPLPAAAATSLPAELLSEAWYGSQAYPDLEAALGVVSTESTAQMRFVDHGAVTQDAAAAAGAGDDAHLLCVYHAPSVSAYLQHWGTTMHAWYRKRKAAVVDDAERAMRKLRNVIRFICETRRRSVGAVYPAAVFTEAEQSSMRETALPDLATLLEEGGLRDALLRAGYDDDRVVSPRPTPLHAETALDKVSIQAEAEAAASAPPTFEYLTSIRIVSQTESRLLKLVQDYTRAVRDLDARRATTPERMWVDDIALVRQELRRAIDERRELTKFAYEARQAGAAPTAARGTKRPRKTGSGGKSAPKRARAKA